MKEKKYEIIAQNLKQCFLKGEFICGQQIPTEHELMERYQASRTTVRRALKILEAEYLIRKTQGAGTYYCGEETFSRNNPKLKGLIGLVNFHYFDYIYAEIIRGVEDSLSHSGYSLILANSNENEDNQISNIQSMIDQGVEGLIFEPSPNIMVEENHNLIEILEKSGIVVVNTHLALKRFESSTVELNDYSAGFQAAEYLINKGHTQLGIVYKSDVPAGYDRYNGFVNAQEARGISMNSQLSRSYSQEDEKRIGNPGYQLTASILKEKDHCPSAIFYMNDRLALEGYKAINDAGLSVPYDISVLGFDDYETSSMLQPGLTTFIHPKYKLGKWAARIMIDMLETDPPRIPVSMTFEPKLMERGSVKELQTLSETGSRDLSID